MLLELSIVRTSRSGKKWVSMRQHMLIAIMMRGPVNVKLYHKLPVYLSARGLILQHPPSECCASRMKGSAPLRQLSHFRCSYAMSSAHGNLQPARSVAEVQQKSPLEPPLCHKIAKLANGTALRFCAHLYVEVMLHYAASRYVVRLLRNSSI